MNDKVKHFVGCAFIVLASYAAQLITKASFNTRIKRAICFSISIGVLKESCDALGFGTPELADLAADFLGAIAGGTAIILFRKIIQVQAPPPPNVALDLV